MDSIARDEIWNTAYDTMYNSGYNESVADKMVLRWKRFDDGTRVLVALTTAGSAGAAGLAIWSLPIFRQIWIGMSSLAVILAILSASIHAPAMLKTWTASKLEFGSLYIELETFMFRMKISPDFDAEKFRLELEGYRKRYGEIKQRIPNDWLATDGIGKSSQGETNEEMRRFLIQKPPQ